MLRIDDRDDRVEAVTLFHLVIGEKRLCDRRRIREAGGLDDDAVELVLAFEQPAEDADEIAADTATNAAIVHLEKLFVALDHELMINAHLAKLVFDHRQFLAVMLRDNTVQQRGFAGAE